MSFTDDPAEGAAIDAAIQWAEDRGCAVDYPTLTALVEAADLAPEDRSRMTAMVPEFLRTEEIHTYRLVVAPPFAPVGAGRFFARPGPIAGTAIVLIIYPPEEIAQLFGGAP